MGRGREGRTWSRDESVFAENLMIWHPRFWRHQTTTALGNGFYNSANPFEDLEKSGPVGNVFRQKFGELVIWWFGGHRTNEGHNDIDKIKII